MKFDEILNLNNKNLFAIEQQNTNSIHLSQGDIDGASTVAGKLLAGRAGVLFLILALLFLSIVTKTRPIFIIFIVVIIGGLFHEEIFRLYLSIAGYFQK